MGILRKGTNAMFRIRNRWKNSKVHRNACIEGNVKNIKIGKNSLIEEGVVLSVLYGGRIIIGENCEIKRGTIISTYGGDIIIGDFCGFNPYCVIYGHGGTSIGNYVRFATQCVVVPANHGFLSLDVPIYKQPLTKKGIIVEDDVWFGAGVKLLDGIKVGKGSVVAAGAVVNRSVPDYSVVGGVPARVLKMRNNQHK